MTTVTHKGTDREWSGPLDNWMAHSECIKHWCDGGEVIKLSSGNWKEVSYPMFRPAAEYKIKQREPKPGEVWLSDKNYTVLVTDKDGYVYLENSELMCYGDCVRLHTGKLAWRLTKFIAPTVESYYAAKFYKESLCKDAGFDYEDSAKLMQVVKKLVDRE